LPGKADKVAAMADRRSSTPKADKGPSRAATAFDFNAVLAIADSLPVMVAYCDRDEVYRFCNRPIADWFERPRHEILGRKVAEVMGEQAYARRKDSLAMALAGERQWFSASFEHPTRGLLTTQAEYIPQLAPDGTVAGVIMVVEDITEQRLAEIALRESEERFRRIADSAPVPMWVTRSDRSRDFVNQAYVDLLGVDAEQARTADWTSRIHPDDRERMIRETLAGEASGGTFTVEARFERRPGDQRWMRAVSRPRRDADGAIVGYIGVATDITLTKQAEIELRRQVEARTAELSASEARFRAIYDAVLEIIVLLRPDGTVVEVNRTEASWRHPAPRSAIGAKLWDAPTLGPYPQLVAPLREAVAHAATGETFNTEIKMEREGTATAFLDVTIQPILDSGGLVSYLLFEARDITDLKHAQEQLRQSQKMEALGQLTGGIAHDFNNLLTVVVGGLDIISRGVDDARLKTFADNALSAAERGARLTAQLLAFSRVQRLEVRPTHVAPLIEAMRPLLLNVLGPQIGKQFDLDPQVFPVMADPTQLELAVLNLAINARDAMPRGGLLRIASTMQRIDDDAELAPGDYMELSISDTGSGMPPEVAARAFDPFFTTKDIGKGTGLGLSMVYGVARQSGGIARIESREGEGTIVRLYFRRAETDSAEPVQSVADRTAVEGGGKGRSVLLIDDDPAVRGFIAASLGEMGYAVTEASDGPAGIAAFSAARPDIVVIDFAMPGMTGAEVADQILKQVPGQPLLFVSGYSETDAIRRAAPGAPLLTKPFLAEDLDQALRALVDAPHQPG
jgi:PAS domain S-box-containing protein